MILSDILEEKVSVTEANSYEVTAYNVLDKVKILDILARTTNNELINIELNSSFEMAIIERNLIYYMDLICKGFKHNKNNSIPITKRLQINLNFNRLGNHPKEYIKIYNLTERKVYYNNFEIINVNVLKYKEMCYDKNVKGNLEHIYLVSLVSNEDELKKLGLKDNLLKKVGDKVFELNDDEKIRDQIERELEAKILYQNGLDYAKKDGYDNGYDNGIKDGIINTKKEIVQNLLQAGTMEIETIAKITKLDKKEILKIQKEMNQK